MARRPPVPRGRTDTDERQRHWLRSTWSDLGFPDLGFQSLVGLTRPSMHPRADTSEPLRTPLERCQKLFGIYRLPLPMWAIASISTRISGAASALTSTRVEAGKSPVKNSRRAAQTLTLFLIFVT